MAVFEVLMIVLRTAVLKPGMSSPLDFSTHSETSDMRFRIANLLIFLPQLKQKHLALTNESFFPIRAASQPTTCATLIF